MSTAAHPPSGAPAFVFEPLHDGVEPPAHATTGAAGYDLRAWLAGRTVKLHSPTGGETERGTEPTPDGPGLPLHPGEVALIPTGFRAAVPSGFAALVLPRSGTSFRRGIILPNAPGLIDADYRGEWGILVRNVSERVVSILHRERIAQLVFVRVERLAVVTGAVDETARGAGGFGSTGAR